jgi:hypothetical protein
MKPRYFNLRFEDPNRYGDVVEVDTDRELKITDFIYEDEDLKVLARPIERQKHETLFEITVPKRTLTSGHQGTAITPSVLAGLYRNGERTIQLVLTERGELKKVNNNKQIYLDEINHRRALRIRSDLRCLEMELLYIAGV